MHVGLVFTSGDGFAADNAFFAVGGCWIETSIDVLDELSGTDLL